jgi:hypothetical protein
MFYKKTLNWTFKLIQLGSPPQHLFFSFFI